MAAKRNDNNFSYTPGTNGKPGENPYWRNNAQKVPFQFPWWAILLGFCITPPLGIAGIIVNLVLKSVTTTTNAPPTFYQPPAKPAPTPRPAAKPKTGDKSSSVDKILTIIGIVVTIIGVVATISTIGEGIDAGSFARMMEDLLTGLTFAISGGGMLAAGLHLRNKKRLLTKAKKIVGNADSMYIEDIAGAIPCGYEKCCSMLEDGISQGLFGEDAYLDMRTRCLVVRGKAPQPAAKPAPAKAASDAPAKKGDERYQQILKELRTLNNAIPGEEMTDKISRLEAVSAKIFQQAQSSPQKLPQMRKFMDYYLPTALKLLKTYAELDAQGIEGDNISESKHRIEQAMDTLVVAFENQLDKLFQSESLDISTDIDVMENMLAADGLTRNNDPFNLYHGQEPTAPQPPANPE